MRFLEMAFAFAVLGFIVANAVISLIVTVAWRFLRQRALSADALFVLRILPAAGSALLVLGLSLPSFLLYEPRDTAERAGPLMAVIVAAALALVLAGTVRALRGWLRTRDLERAWRAGAVPTDSLKMPIPTYRVPTRVPLAALVGVLRPRLFVSGAFIDALSSEERQTVLDHEAAHLAKLDNFKRLSMRLAPDWLAGTRDELEHAWAAACEEEADDLAVRLDPRRRLDLAGALIKGSRFAPVHCEGVSSFCDKATVARRVARLLADLPARRKVALGSSRRIAAATTAVLVLGIALGLPALRAVYELTEAAVRLLRFEAW